jgi:flagellin
MSTEVALTRATRDTISTLRSSIEQAKTAGDRIGSGKRVNSAMEDPSAFFTSLSLSAHAAELDRSLEQVSQGVQVVKAAYDGMTAIEKLVGAAQAIVTRAAESGDAFDRAEYAKTYNQLLDQMEDVARDSGYRGKNLLLGTGHDLKLYFGDARADAITIEAIDYTDVATTLGLARVPEQVTGLMEARLTDGSGPLAPADKLVSAAGQFGVGDTVEVRNSGGDLLASYTVTAGSTVRDLVNALGNADKGLRASFDQSGVFKLESATDVTVTGGTAGGDFAGASLDATESGWYAATATDAETVAIKDAKERMRLQTVTFGTSLTMLQSRERFVKEFTGTLVSGSESLVAADLDEEAANLLALQLRQQFASGAMSFANQADQGVLRLLGG